MFYRAVALVGALSLAASVPAQGTATINFTAVGGGVANGHVMISIVTPGGIGTGTCRPGAPGGAGCPPSNFNIGDVLILNALPDPNYVFVVFSTTNSGIYGQGATYIVNGPDTIGVFFSARFMPLGGGTVGVNGVPVLQARGDTLPGATVTLELLGAAPNAYGIGVVSFPAVPTPFLGGVIHIFPELGYVEFTTTATGENFLPFVWPSVPFGTQFHFQAFVTDASNPFGATLSNGLKSL